MELSVRRLFFVDRRLRCCSNPPLRRFTNFQIKQKLQHLYDAGVLGGRGWMSQAAHRKRPHRGLFAAGTYSGGPYELRLPIFLQPLGGALKNRSAAPASPPCFRRRRQSAPLLFESTLGYALKSFRQKKNSSIFTTLEFLVGAGGFEPPKLKSSRFTVCPHWPLGNTPIFFLCPLPDDLLSLS